MRILLFFVSLILPTQAFAHLGHLGELAGHSHWIALGAGAVAIAIAGLVAKGEKDKEESDENIGEETEIQEEVQA